MSRMVLAIDRQTSAWSLARLLREEIVGCVKTGSLRNVWFHRAVLRLKRTLDS